MSLPATTKHIQRLVGAHPDGIYGPETAGKILFTLLDHAPCITTPPAEEGLSFDTRTQRALDSLHPKAAETFTPFLRRAIAIGAAMGVTVKAICGRRTRAAQNAAKARGASRASYGYSWHNYGMAIDLGLFKGRSYLDSDNPTQASRVYAAIGAVATDYGLEWGGSWRRFKDSPHFHIDLGRTTPNAADRRALASGTWTY